MENYSIQNVSCKYTIVYRYTSSFVLSPKDIENISAHNVFIAGVLNASDPSQTGCFMSLKEENTVNMISMFYLHHAVESAVSTRLLY